MLRLRSAVRCDSVQSLSDQNVACYRKHCTETECEDATLDRHESTCGNLKKCPIFKHLVLVPGSAAESNRFRLRYCAQRVALEVRPNWCSTVCHYRLRVVHGAPLRSEERRVGKEGRAGVRV